jgi:G:T-mismatch repair DNA endonuclease (very short patch repair protein)
MPLIIFWSMIFFVVYKCEMREDLKIQERLQKLEKLEKECSYSMDEEADMPHNITGIF